MMHDNLKNEDIKILIIDDDESNRFCAAHNLKRFIGYSNFAEADNGSSGLDYLRENPDVDIILLDKMMDDVDGVEMLKLMQSSSLGNDIEVIFQTSATTDEEKAECMKAGSLYLLEKPYDDAGMAQILDLVSQRVRARRRLSKYLQNPRPLEYGQALCFRTPQEVEHVATQVAACFPQPEMMLEPVYELLINAIEHGNLELGYKSKKELLKAAKYHDEIARRLEDENYKERHASVRISKKSNGNIQLDVQDGGKGVDETSFDVFGPKWMSEPNGRGIFKIRQYFDEVSFQSEISTVSCLWVANKVKQ